jgi:archaellum biogenesis ATPase FlaH
MTDVADTSNPATTVTPAIEPVVTPAADPAAEFTTKIADLEAKLAEQVTRASELAAERDALAERTKLIDSLTGERDKALAEVTKLTNTSRENALLDKLYAALPHAPRTDVLRTVRALAAEGKVTMATETPDRTANEVLGMLRTEQSALLRTPVGASGSTNPTPIVSPQVDPLLAVFGPRRK